MGRWLGIFGLGIFFLGLASAQAGSDSYWPAYWEGDYDKARIAYWEENYQMALRKFLEAAEQGNVDAHWWLGYLHEKGRGVAQDDAKAARWYRKAFGRWSEAAERGDAEAQFRIGRMYFHGRGVARDFVLAVQWHRKAAEQRGEDLINVDLRGDWSVSWGEADAVAGEWSKAVERWRAAANQDDADAQYWLGQAFDFGYGVEQDHGEAEKWTRKAAEQGNADAQYWLGRMHHEGRGIRKKDYKKAEEWFRKAAEQGHATAQYQLGSILGGSEMVKWWRKAAEQGHAEAQYDFGQLIQGEYGHDESFEEAREALAVDWWREAAQEGDAEAQLWLGQAYKFGYGVEKDGEEAEKWIRRAARQGIVAAQFRWLGNLAGEELTAQEKEGLDEYTLELKGPRVSSEAGSGWIHKAIDQGYVSACVHFGYDRHPPSAGHPCSGVRYKIEN